MTVPNARVMGALTSAGAGLVVTEVMSTPTSANTPARYRAATMGADRRGEQTTPASSSIGRRLRGSSPVERGSAVFVAYATISGLLYIRGAFAHLGTWCVGGCHSDTMVYLWSLRWMPFALSQGLNPLFTTHYIWAPQGIDLVWVTTIPGPSFVLAPVTSIWGPLASDNLILWLAPALAAWACYLLCNQLTSHPLP